MELFLIITLAVVFAFVLLAGMVLLVFNLGMSGLLLGILVLFIIFCFIYPLYIGIKNKQIAKKRKKAAAYKNYKEKYLHDEL